MTKQKATTLLASKNGSVELVRVFKRENDVLHYQSYDDNKVRIHDPNKNPNKKEVSSVAEAEKWILGKK